MAFVKECHQEADARFSPAGVWKAGQNYPHDMKFTTSLTKNHEFKRLYNKGKSAASKYVVVYYRKNRNTENRLGITVSTKLGGAVQRNRVRRRLKEIYRLHEHSLQTGCDVVLVARLACRHAKWCDLESSVLSLFLKLGIINPDPSGRESRLIWSVCWLE